MNHRILLSLALGASPWCAPIALGQAVGAPALAPPGDSRWSAALGIDNANNYSYWNFHPYPQRTYTAELRYDL